MDNFNERILKTSHIFSSVVIHGLVKVMHFIIFSNRNNEPVHSLPPWTNKRKTKYWYDKFMHINKLSQQVEVLNILSFKLRSVNIIICFKNNRPIIYLKDKNKNE